ncbi:MAG: hypothetical protein NUV67_04800, partial [archaeon]|nr:hypothetical protein [archaeon]
KKTLGIDVLVRPGNRLKLAIKTTDKNASLSLDKSSVFSKSEYVAPGGETFFAKGVEATAILYLVQCNISEITCALDLDCDDLDPFTSDTCVNPGTCQSSCNRTQCTPSCIDGTSCADQDPLTVDSCRNSGTCQATCENTTCNPSCSSNSECNDGNQATSDRCIYPGTCFASCQNVPSAASGATIEENGCTIKQCLGEACEEQTKNYCCANSLCEQGETCSADCTQDAIEIISPTRGFYAPKGGEINISARAIAGEELIATGFFGTQTLFDDGAHSDGAFGDGVYSATVNAGTDQEGEATIKISNGKTESFVHISIAPLLEVSLSADKSEYAISDPIIIKGNVARKSEPVSASATLVAFATEAGSAGSASYVGKKVFEETIQLDKFGNFTYSYKSLSLDPAGEWTIKLRTADEYGNEGMGEIKVAMLAPEDIFPIKIRPEIAPKGSYSRDELVELKVSLAKGFEKISGAKVEAVLSDGTRITMEETGQAIYSASFRFPQTVKNGSAKIIVEAKQGSLMGKATLTTTLLPEELKINVKSPQNRSFGIGETINFRFTVALNENPSTVQPSLSINGEKIEVTEKGGEYIAAYIVPNVNEFEYTIYAIDPAGNEGVISQTAMVSGYSAEYYLREYNAAILGIAGIAALLLLGLGYFYVKDQKSHNLKKREKELVEKMKFLQIRYFKMGSLSRKKYDELMLKYEQELQTVRKKMGGAVDE